VTAIRAADTDGNDATEPDTSWSPLLVTPNFPSFTSAHSTVSGAAAGVLTALFGDYYHFTVGAESVSYTRSFDSFDAAAAEAGQSRIYGGIHYQFDNQAAQTSGHAVGRFVVGNFLRPADEWHEPDGRNDDHTGGRGDFPAEGLALLLAGPSYASATTGSGISGQQVSAAATGQPTEVLAATPVDKDQPMQHAGAGDRLAARVQDLRVLDQALAGLDDSGFAEALQGDAVFAWAR